MPTNYVLVDFENVQPDLSLLANTAYKVKVFFGAKQQEGRVPYKLLKAMIALGGNVEAVEVKRSGKNALDMHIAYYVGKLLAAEPGASIHIVSADTDFDPLIEYLHADNVRCKRTKTIADIVRTAEGARPAPQPRARAPRSGARPAKAAPVAPKEPLTDPLADLVKHLGALSGKPANRKKLAQAIRNYSRHHDGPLADGDIEKVIDDLIRRKLVSQSGTRLSYHLG